MESSVICILCKDNVKSTFKLLELLAIYLALLRVRCNAKNIFFNFRGKKEKISKIVNMTADEKQTNIIAWLFSVSQDYIISLAGWTTVDLFLSLAHLD